MKHVQEIDLYLHESYEEEDTDPLIFWKTNASKYPHLSKIAPKYLSLPASYAQIERIFSPEQQLYQLGKNRLSDKNLEIMMFIKCNYDV